MHKPYFNCIYSVFLLPEGYLLSAPFSFVGTIWINVNSNFLTKLKLSFVSIISLSGILLITFGISMALGFILIPVILMGLAGVLTLGINSLLIEHLNVSYFTALLTFLLSMLPLIMVDYVNHNSTFDNAILYNIGLPFLWLLSVSLGITLSLQKKENSLHSPQLSKTK